jgi:hypothetical protein
MNSMASHSRIAAYREYLPDLTTERFQRAKTQDPYEYARWLQENQSPPWICELTELWKKLYEEPFKGVTTDGKSPLGCTIIAVRLML